MKKTRTIGKGEKILIVNKNNSVSYSNEEKKKASQMSTVDYLQRNYGFTFNFKNNYYKCEQHDSLIIYADQRGWAWNSRGLKGSDVIQFIMSVENKSYHKALNILILNNEKPYLYTEPIETKDEVKVLELPEATNEKFSRVFAYLHYSRRIDKSIISECMKNKSLYQDTRGNCVFVGYKGTTPAYATIRGTLTDRKYRGDCSGSDKRYSFNMTYNTTSKELYVFESAIDAMSHATIANLIFDSNTAYKDTNRLALGGLNSIALDQYLKDHPQVTTLNFCFDNDCNAVKKDGTPAPNYGQEFAKQCCDNYAKKGYKVKNICPKTKDFNDDLIDYYLPQAQKIKEKSYGSKRRNNL